MISDPSIAHGGDFCIPHKKRTGKLFHVKHMFVILAKKEKRRASPVGLFAVFGHQTIDKNEGRAAQQDTGKDGKLAAHGQ
jgi:hypothetical protein